MLVRLHDWPERLTAYIGEREFRAFEWGKGAHDCCSFANGGIIAQTGVDLMADIPDYSDEAGAVAILEQGIETLIDARLTRRASRGLAQRGDIALADLRGVLTVCLVEGEKIIGPGKDGLERLPRKCAAIMWAV